MNLTQSHWPLMLATRSPATGTLPVEAPFDGQSLATVATCGKRHIEDALTVAYELFANRDAWLPVDERVDILHRAAELMQTHHELLAVEAAREGGKPLIDSRVEVTRAIDGVRLAAEHIRSHQGDVVPMGGTPAGRGRLAFTQKEPVGVVVAVSAFNHPLNLIVHQVAAAFAAGCPTIVKPADDTPLSCLRFVALLREAGLGELWCQVAVPESLDVAQALVTDPRVGFFSFIGSAKVGWHLRSLLSPGTRCALEHGGAAPVILADDAKLDVASASILKGGYYHAGQVCVSVQRVFAPAAIAKEFADIVAADAAKLIVGDPSSASTDVGPLIRAREVKRVHGWVKESGVTPLTGGEPLGDTLYQPTLLLNPPDAAKVSQQEIFGPVVCVYEYDRLDEAIDRANSVPFAFQSAVYTQDIDLALRAFRRLNASAVMVNDHSAFRVDGMPFAGLRESGYGVGGIPYTIDDMTIDKMLVLKSGELI